MNTNLLINVIYNYIKYHCKQLFYSYNFKYKTQKHNLKDILEAYIRLIKILLITGSYRLPIHLNIESGNLHDCNILNKQLIDFMKIPNI